MSVVLEEFEDDPFITEMLDLAMTDEDEANRLIEDADEQGGWGGRMLAAYRRQYGARELAKALVARNQGLPQ